MLYNSYINTSETGWVSPDKMGGGSSLSAMIANWFGDIPPTISVSGGVVDTNCDGVVIDGVCTGGIKAPLTPTGIATPVNTSTAIPVANMPQTLVNENVLQGFIKNNPILALGCVAIVTYLLFAKK